MSKPKSHQPFMAPSRPGALLPKYARASLRSSYFYSQGLVQDSTKAAREMDAAGDKQADLVADLGIEIGKNRAGDLYDVYAKLLVLEDSLKHLFDKSDDLDDARRALETALDWVHANATCGSEALAPEITVISEKKAA